MPHQSETHLVITTEQGIPLQRIRWHSKDKRKREHVRQILQKEKNPILLTFPGRGKVPLSPPTSIVTKT